MIKAFIFDLDGTLINSLDDLANACNVTLSQLGYPTHSVDAYKYFIGDGVLKLIERILPKEKVNAEEIEKARDIEVAYYSKHCFDKTKLYDGIAELLEALKQRDYKLAVVSNKPHLQTESVISVFFREGLFDVITGNREGYAPKPDPALTKTVMAQLGLHPEECVFVGDSGMDMLTAVRAGALPVGVTWGFRLRDELTENGAKHIVDHPADILTLFDSESIQA